MMTGASPKGRRSAPPKLPFGCAAGDVGCGVADAKGQVLAPDGDQIVHRAACRVFVAGFSMLFTGSSLPSQTSGLRAMRVHSP